MLPRSTQANTPWWQVQEKSATLPSHSACQEKGSRLLQTGLHRIKAAISHRNRGSSPDWGLKMAIGGNPRNCTQMPFMGIVHLLGRGSVVSPDSRDFRQKNKGLIPTAVRFNHLPALSQFGSQTPAATGAQTSDHDLDLPQAPTSASRGPRTLLL